MAEIKEMQISLKLLVDTKSNKVLFAEATKEFIDFIFRIMSLPLGTILKLLDQNKMVGCLGDLYQSISSFDTQYFQSDRNKDFVLSPESYVNIPLLSLNETTSNNNPKKFYMCGSCNANYRFVTDSFGMKCLNHNCYGIMSTEVKYVKQVNAGNIRQLDDGGYVKGVVKYMVMDNLEVKPMSNISGITLLNKFHIKDVSALEERDVHVGFEQALGILRSCLESKSVLTDVFLDKKPYL